VVAGVFGDGMFGSLKGSIIENVFAPLGTEGRDTLRSSWAAGARVGLLVAPNVLSYVNAGYVDSEWSGSVYTSLKSGGLGNTPLLTTPGFHRDGWFVGGGVESGLNIFGIAAPGRSLKSEYRAAYFDRIALPENWHPSRAELVRRLTP
jgi:outer membrane immunogenic protein